MLRELPSFFPRVKSWQSREAGCLGRLSPHEQTIQDLLLGLLKRQAVIPENGNQLAGLYGLAEKTSSCSPHLDKLSITLLFNVEIASVPKGESSTLPRANFIKRSAEPCLLAKSVKSPETSPQCSVVGYFLACGAHRSGDERGTVHHMQLGSCILSPPSSDRHFRPIQRPVLNSLICR